MPVTRIVSGGMEVFGSGTVTAFGEEPIEFTLEHDDDVMELVFDFVDDGGEPHIEVEVVDARRRAKIDVYNHFEGRNVGAEKPFNVGAIGGRALHLIYHVNTITREDGHTPIFSYTFYLGDEFEEREVTQ